MMSIPATAASYNPVVVLETNFGNIAIELYPQQAPITVDNFLHYVNTGYYNYLLFHRVIYGFMIQGGGYYMNKEGGVFPATPTAPSIINESYNGLKNLRGTIAMARTSDPDSAAAEFFINHIDNSFLDRENAYDGYGYCVFGRVISGMNVVDAIAQVQTCNIGDGLTDFPCNPVVGMYRAYVLPCDASYCSNLNNTNTRIDLADFAEFALHWLDDTCGPANSFCNGSDLDYNGQVDLADLSLYLDHWNRTVGYEPQFSDLISDGQIDLLDLMALLEDWLANNCGPDNYFCYGSDIDRNGTVNLDDIALLSANWLQTP